MRVLVSLLVAATNAACATPYQSIGFSGGVNAEQMTGDTFRIVARGNGYTGRNTIQDYVLLKSAETAKAHGATHFIILSSADATRTSVATNPGYAQTNIVGKTAFTTFTPGTTVPIFKPGQDAYIRITSVAPGAPPPQGAFEVEEIIRFVGKRVRQPAE